MNKTIYIKNYKLDVYYKAIKILRKRHISFSQFIEDNIVKIVKDYEDKHNLKKDSLYKEY